MPCRRLRRLARELATTTSLPNVRVAEEAVSLMRATKALGLEPGVGDADKQYWANSTTERLHVKEKTEAKCRVVLRCPALDPSPTVTGPLWELLEVWVRISKFPSTVGGMTDVADARTGWASVLLVVGGLLMAVLWLIFTTAHGPTSFNEDRTVLGGSMLFWGMLLGGIPNLLIAAGLVIFSPRVALAARRSARVGYVLTLIGLIAPALIDLSIQALGAPFFLPMAAIGLALLASGNRHNPRVSRPSLLLLMAIGVLLAIAMALALLPNALTDPIGGYRIYGSVAYLGAGIGWALFGIGIRGASPHPT